MGEFVERIKKEINKMEQDLTATGFYFLPKNLTELIFLDTPKSVGNKTHKISYRLDRIGFKSVPRRSKKAAIPNRTVRFRPQVKNSTFAQTAKTLLMFYRREKIEIDESLLTKEISVDTCRDFFEPFIDWWTMNYPTHHAEFFSEEVYMNFDEVESISEIEFYVSLSHWGSSFDDEGESEMAHAFLGGAEAVASTLENILYHNIDDDRLVTAVDDEFISQFGGLNKIVEAYWKSKNPNKFLNTEFIDGAPKRLAQLYDNHNIDPHEFFINEFSDNEPVVPFYALKYIDFAAAYEGWFLEFTNSVPNGYCLFSNDEYMTTSLIRNMCDVVRLEHGIEAVGEFDPDVEGQFDDAEICVAA